MQQIQFTGQNIEITPILRDFISNKFKKLKRYAEDITSTHVILNVDSPARQIAEAKLHVPGSEIYAKAESEDMYKTIDVLVDKLVRQLSKHKGKATDHR
ncbi:MAG: ribosome-associated translation inhibitor RaiA [Gammaproteobacteria bacterium]|nr:ribosome-associated translation inhibitor RaiA [Gammaproteobacteria bacterium]